MKKRIWLIIAVLLVCASIIFLLITARHNDNHYSYILQISTSKNVSYEITISVPDGWPNFVKSLNKNESGVVFSQTSINKQPALNISGKGNSSLDFEMDSENEYAISFNNNWYQNGTTAVYLDRNLDLPISIEMYCSHKNTKTNSDSSYMINATLSNDGWQYVHMEASAS